MTTKQKHDLGKYELIEAEEPPHLFCIDDPEGAEAWFISFSHVAIGRHGISFYADLGYDHGELLLMGGLSDGVDNLPEAVLEVLSSFPEYERSRIDEDLDND